MEEEPPFLEENEISADYRTEFAIIPSCPITQICEPLFENTENSRQNSINTNETSYEKESVAKNRAQKEDEEVDNEFKSPAKKTYRKHCGFLDTPMQNKYFKRGKAVCSQTAVMFVNVVNFCDNEWTNVRSKARQGEMSLYAEQINSMGLLAPINTPIARAAKILNVSEASIKNVLKRCEKLQSFDTPKAQKESAKFPKIDGFMVDYVRRTVHSYFKKGEHVSLDILLDDLKKNSSFPYGRSTLWQLLKTSGFYFRKRGNRIYLYERPDVVQKRYKFLLAVLKAKRQGKDIYWTDETWVNAGQQTSYCWADKMVEKEPHKAMVPNSGLSLGYKDAVGKGGRLIIFHIGNEKGFVEGSELVFQASNKLDYHDEMDGERFEEHFLNVVCPKLPENAVVVMDNAPYHSRLLNKPPTSASRRSEMENWLVNEGIIVDPRPRTKIELYEKYIKPIRDDEKYKKYVVDEAAKSIGIEIIRLPPYHCVFNPIENIWGILKPRVAKRNTTFTLSSVKSLVCEEFDKCTPVIWGKCVERAWKIIHEYSLRDRAVPEIEVDPLIVIADDSDSSLSDSEGPNEYEGEEVEFVAPDIDDLQIANERDFDDLQKSINHVTLDTDGDNIDEYLAELFSKDPYKRVSGKKLVRNIMKN